MSRLLDDSELRTSMGKRGRRLVERSFTWPIAAEQMINLYERILKGIRERDSLSMIPFRKFRQVTDLWR